MRITTLRFLFIILAVFIFSITQAQVKIGDNPTQIVTGAKLQVDGDNTTSTETKLIVTGGGNVGVGTANPGTKLDINGAITNRETEITVSGNAVTIPANTSMVRITGTATNSINVTVPAAPNPGQRLIIFNNTVGGFGSILNSISIPNGKALEFVYSGGGWQSINTLNAPAILPYASSSPVTLTTIAGGLAGTGATIGFGSSIFGLDLSAGNIDITGGTGINLNFGFTVPRDGTLKSISAFFSAAAAVSLIGTTVNVKAQLYKSTTIGSNDFAPVPGAEVSLSPGLTGSVTLGTTCSGINNTLSIPVTAQSRYLLVFSSSASGISLITSVNGYASAGLSIE
jgi:BclB C-terminal domain-containing protein